MTKLINNFVFEKIDVSQEYKKEKGKPIYEMGNFIILNNLQNLHFILQNSLQGSKNLIEETKKNPHFCTLIKTLFEKISKIL